MKVLKYSINFTFKSESVRIDYQQITERGITARYCNDSYPLLKLETLGMEVLQL